MLHKYKVHRFSCKRWKFFHYLIFVSFRKYNRVYICPFSCEDFFLQTTNRKNMKIWLLLSLFLQKVHLLVLHQQVRVGAPNSFLTVFFVILYFFFLPFNAISLAIFLRTAPICLSRLLTPASLV